MIGSSVRVRGSLRIQGERVKQYDEGIRNGGILMGVRPRNEEDANHLSTAWKSNRAENVYS